MVPCTLCVVHANAGLGREVAFETAAQHTVKLNTHCDPVARNTHLPTQKKRKSGRTKKNLTEPVCILGSNIPQLKKKKTQ